MGYLEKKRNAMLNSISAEQPPLPREYQEVEYIQSHTGECINTGFIPNQNTKINVCFETTNETGTYGDRTVFVWGSDNTWRNGYKLDFINFFRITFGDNIYDTRKNPVIGEKNVIETTKDYSIINGTEYTYSFNNTTVNNPLMIFAINRAGTTLLDFGRFKFYYMKIYNNDILERDFVPCYRKSDGEIGLYDLVYGQFYTNQGTGTFTKGGDV